MAITSITNTGLKFNAAKAMPVTAAVDATNGAKINFSAKEDSRILIIIENAAAAAKSATVKAGNSIQGIKDLSISLLANEKKLVCIESGKYMNVSGTNSGYVIVKGEDANIKIAAVELP